MRMHNPQTTNLHANIRNILSFVTIWYVELTESLLARTSPVPSVESDSKETHPPGQSIQGALICIHLDPQTLESWRAQVASVAEEHLHGT